jgi:hypothetical protein
MKSTSLGKSWGESPPDNVTKGEETNRAQVFEYLRPVCFTLGLDPCEDFFIDMMLGATGPMCYFSKEKIGSCVN